MKNKKVNLNDICFFQEGPGVRKYQYCTKGVKLINVSNLVNGEIDLSNSNRYISQEEAYGRYKHFLIDEGDLIIASSGIKVEYLDKKVAFIKKENLPLCMNTSTIRFKVKNKNELDILYLSYFLKSKNFKNQISKLITGSAQLNFGGSHLKKINLFLPELNVQKKVSTLLLLIDNTIKNMQRKISILEQLTKSLFIRMFGDPLTNDRIEWKFSKIKNIGKIISGSTPNTNTPELWNGDYLWITPAELKDDSFIVNSTERKLTYLGIKNSSLIEMPIGTVLLSSRAPIGKVAIVGKNMFCNQGFKNIIPNEEINSIYLYYILKEKKEYLNFLGRGATFKELSKEIVENISLKIPPIELQNKFAERVEKIEKLKFTIWKIILKVYETLKKKGVESN